MSNHTHGPWVFKCEDVGNYGSNQPFRDFLLR